MPGKLVISRRTLMSFLLCSCFWIGLSAQVTVSKEMDCAKGEAIYRYTIRNGITCTSCEVDTFYLGGGFDQVLPQFTCADPLSSLSPFGEGTIESPKDWSPWITWEQDTTLFCIVWRTRGSMMIKPGESVEGFAIHVPLSLLAEQGNSDPFIRAKYFLISEPFAMLYGDSKPAENGGKTPKILLTLSPDKNLIPDNKMFPVSAAVKVTEDDCRSGEKAQVIRLVSITCNEDRCAGDIQGADIGTDDRSFFLRAKTKGRSKEGRVYTVTYSATDADGRTETASATVIVPGTKNK